MLIKRYALHLYTSNRHLIPLNIKVCFINYLWLVNKILLVIKSMYHNISLTVQSGDGLALSPFFRLLVGVRQGDNISPALFNLFINDLPKIFNDSCDPILFGNMHLSGFMYADDLLIFSESSQGLPTSHDKSVNIY